MVLLHRLGLLLVVLLALDADVRANDVVYDRPRPGGGRVVVRRTVKDQLPEVVPGQPITLRVEFQDAIAVEEAGKPPRALAVLKTGAAGFRPEHLASDAPVIYDVFVGEGGLVVLYKSGPQTLASYVRLTADGPGEQMPFLDQIVLRDSGVTGVAAIDGWAEGAADGSAVKVTVACAGGVERGFVLAPQPAGGYRWVEGTPALRPADRPATRPADGATTRPAKPTTRPAASRGGPTTKGGN